MPQEVRRGEIYWVDWNPARGSDQSGPCPALVIQNDIGNRFSPNTIVASVTTAPTKLYPFMVRITPGESGLSEDSIADLESIMTVSKSRLQGVCGRLGEVKMAKVDKAICNSLAL